VTRPRHAAPTAGRLARGLASALSLPAAYLLPTRPGRVALTSFHGEGFRGSPRALFEHLVADGRLDPVWLTTDQRTLERVRAGFGRTLAHPLHSRAGLLALASARAIVLSHGVTDFPGMHLSRRAIRLHTYHGLPTKRGGLMTVDGRPPSLRERARVRRAMAPISAFLTSSPLVTELFAARFGLPTERFLALGYPGYDVLHRPDPPALLAELTEAPPARRWLLYAPTFRYREPTRFFPFPDASPARFAAHLEAWDAVCVIRPHPNERIAFEALQAASPRFLLVDDRRVEDILPFLPGCAAILTDYSGVYLEGLLADVPCVFIPYDRERYERGLAWDYERYTPGPHVYSQGELVAAIDEALTTPQARVADRARVREAFFAHQTPGATARLADWLADRLQGR